MKTLSMGLACLASAAALMVGSAALAAEPAAAPAAPVAPAAAPRLDRHVTIVNRTHTQINEFYASSVGQNNWEEDILGNDVLAPGASVVVNIDDGTGYCMYDLKAVFDDGDEGVKYRVNVCEISTFNWTE